MFAVLASCASAPAVPPTTGIAANTVSSGTVTPTVPTVPTVVSNGQPSLPGATAVDAPEISRSVGVRGGVVVLWPRIAPRSEDPQVMALTATIQQRLQQLAQRALPGREVNVRPSPERVCPRQGCEAMTVGASVFHTPTGGCSIVALVAGAGMSPQRLVPWVGTMTLREQVVPFREPPESFILVTDMARCSDVVGLLAAHENEVVEAIRAAAPPRP
jgi:hypothetical protein